MTRRILVALSLAAALAGAAPAFAQDAPNTTYGSDAGIDHSPDLGKLGGFRTLNLRDLSKGRRLALPAGPRLTLGDDGKIVFRAAPVWHGKVIGDGRLSYYPDDPAYAAVKEEISLLRGGDWERFAAPGNSLFFSIY